MVNLNIGEGTSSDNFSAISWGTDSYFVKIALDENGGTAYADMGISQLLSVPYALYANQTGGSVSSPWIVDANGINYTNGNVGVGSISTLSKFQIDGTGVAAETPLFEVRNNIGEIVFAVYNEGIRMNVDNASSDHDRGGFAIGGLNMNKGVLNYFQVTPDSVRIYLDETASPTDRGGFAIGGQNMNKQITSEYMFVNTDSTRITTAADGGFGVASKTAGKTQPVNYLNITPANMFIGEDAGKQTTGQYNSFFGFESGQKNVEGAQNVMVGYQSGYQSQGTNNLFIGYRAGYGDAVSSLGANNVFLGTSSGQAIASGNNNLFIGQSTGYHTANGDRNVFLGFESGFSNIDGSQNIFIGNQAGYFENGSDRLYIENTNATDEDALIYGEFDNNIVRMNGDVGIGKEPGNDYLTNGTTDLDVNGEIRGLYFVGNGAGLTGITGTGGIANPGSTTIGADTDQDQIGEIAIQTALQTRMSIYNNGEIEMHNIKTGNASTFTSQTINLELADASVQTADITGLDISLNTTGTGVLNTGGTATGLKVDVTDALGTGGTGNKYAATFVGGNVGIGTTEPIGDLNVHNVLSESWLNLSSGQDVGGIWSFQYKSDWDAINDNALSIAHFNGSLWYSALQISPNGNIGVGVVDPNNTFEVGGTSSFYSNVGIGTTTPEQKLHVNSGGWNGMILDANNNADGAINIEFREI